MQIYRLQHVVESDQVCNYQILYIRFETMVP